MNWRGERREERGERRAEVERRGEERREEKELQSGLFLTLKIRNALRMRKMRKILRLLESQ